MPDTEQPRTVADVLAAAGIAPDRVTAHLAAGRVRVDGEPVTDLAQPAPTGARVNLYAT